MIYTDPLYNLRIKSQAITNENLGIIQINERIVAYYETKNTQAVALGPRKHTKRMGRGRRVLSLHALQRIQNFQKKKHSLQSSNNHHKHSDRNSKLCADNIPKLVATVRTVRNRSHEPFHCHLNNRYAVLED